MVFTGDTDMFVNRRNPARFHAGADDGFTMIFVALLLIVLMLFAAFAVDLGGVYAERRHDQGSVDASGTSGAVLFLTAKSAPAQAAVNEVVSKVNSNLGRTVSSADWIACSDSNPLARTAASLGLTPATPCISFSAGFDRLRVRLPNQTINSAFASVVGLNSFTSSAFVEVTIQPAGGGALPFVVTATNGAGDQICLRTDNSGGPEPPDIPPPPGDPYGTGRQLDPCNSLNYARASGARGTIKPYFYVGCNKPTGNESIVDAMMVGMDHLLGTFDPAVSLSPGADANTLDSNPNARFDGGAGCTVALPNTVAVDTGFTSGLLRCGLLQNPCNSGSSATLDKPGRLSASSGVTFTGLQVDTTPLWNYFVSSLPGSAPASCATAKSSLTAFYTRRAALMDCLKNWTSGQLFTGNIADEARLGFVPKVAELAMCKIQPAPGTGCTGAPPDNVHINTFAPVYLDGLYADEKSGDVCDPTNPATPPLSTEWKIYYPGQSSTLNSCGTGNSVNRLSGIIIPCGSLPAEVCDPSLNSPPKQAGVDKIRIVR